MLLALLALLPLGYAAPGPGFPSLSFTPDQQWTVLPVTLGDAKQNQPMAVNGVLFAGGNAVHPIWDLSNPYSPQLLATLEGPHRFGEAESHQVTARMGPDGSVAVATTSGRGVDLWDLTDPYDPALLAAVELDGINYGDNVQAVWGLAWEGDTLYVGGTSTGLHVLDTQDLTAPVVVARLTQAELGGVSAGPLWAVGRTLVITTPKDRRGVVTLDITDPHDPAVLDWVVPEDQSYIGGFYDRYAQLITPLRTYDVLTDPSNIELVSVMEVERVEYVAYGDDHLFLGAMRPQPGIYKVDLSDPLDPTIVGKVEGRSQGPDLGLFTDDQFSLPIGNLLVVCDDEVSGGCIIGVHDHQPDILPPRVLYSWPADGEAGVSPTARIGLSMSDQLDTRTITPEHVALFALDGPDAGEPVAVAYGLTGTVLVVDPIEPLREDTTYELSLSAGGVSDLVGNVLAQDFRLTFATGDQVASVACDLGALPPVQVGDRAALTPAVVEPDAFYTWELGDGQTASGATIDAQWSEPGRWPVRLTAERDGARRSCAAIQVVHRQLAPARPTASATLALDPARGRVWVVNTDSDTLAEVDATTWELLAEHDAGHSPRTVALGPDGRRWVTSQDDDTVRILGDEPATVQLPWGCRPFGVAFDPAGARAYVSCEGSGEVHAFDATSAAQLASAELYSDFWGPRPSLRGLAVTPDGDTLLVTQFLSSGLEGAVHALDARTLAVREPWSLAYDEGPDTSTSGRGLPNRLSSIAISPDGVRVAVPSGKDNLSRGLRRDGERLNAENTARTVVSWLDLETGAEDVQARLDLDDQDSAYAATFSPTGDLVFIATQGANKVEVHDTYDGRKVGGFMTGLGPQGVSLDDAGRLVVHNALSRTLTVIDVSRLLSHSDATAPRIAEVGLTTRDRLTEEELLGKQIFYNANAREMTADGYISCATCHPDGGHDGQTWDFSDRGEGLRNTQDLRGKRGTGHGMLHWSGNFDEVQDFEHDIRHGFGGAGLMADEDYYDGRDHPLAEPKAGVSDRLDALAAFVTSLDRFPRSPYRLPDGALHPDAERGARVFQRLGCESCHAGPDMTDSKTGARHDVGTLTQASGDRLGERLDGLDTPTLLGLHATAPYLHDGSAPTLYEVLDNPEHVGGRLRDKDKDALVAWMLSLEDAPIEHTGCGCQHGGRAPATAVLTLLALLGWGRRRRTACRSRRHR